MGFRDYLNESKPTVEDYLKSIKKVFPYIEKMHTDGKYYNKQIKKALVVDASVSSYSNSDSERYIFDLEKDEFVKEPGMSIKDFEKMLDKDAESNSDKFRSR
jgi:hypothetical protein